MPTPIAAQVSEATAIGLYAVYASVAIGLVIYLARTLHHNGAVFLINVFETERLAEAINRLLVIGFYLPNLGYAFLPYQLEPDYESLTQAFNQLVSKLGLLLLSLGAIHLSNMAVFWRIRTHSDRAQPRQLPRPTPYTPPPPAPAPAPARSFQSAGVSAGVHPGADPAALPTPGSDPGETGSGSGSGSGPNPGPGPGRTG